jgi:hypothetical protein
LVGCIAGAALIDETRGMIREAGLEEAVLDSRPEFVRMMENMKDPLYRQILTHLPAGSSAADFITSLNVTARKPPAN